jgi:ankyrin repeat protein
MLDAAICIVLRFGYVEILHYLSITYNETLDMSILTNAVTYGNLEVVKFLHKHSDDLNFSSMFGFASCYGHVNILEWLYEQNYEMEPLDRSPAINAALNGHLDILKLLWSKLQEDDVNINMKYIFKYSIEHGHLHVVEWACKQIEQWIYKDRYDLLITALYLAEAHKYIEIIAVLKTKI